jgi:hypothetical protein
MSRPPWLRWLQAKRGAGVCSRPGVYWGQHGKVKDGKKTLIDLIDDKYIMEIYYEIIKRWK